MILRGHQANPWELRPWREPALADRYSVSYLRSRRGWFDTRTLQLDSRKAWTMRDLLPPGRLGDLVVRLPGERYLGLSRHLRGADIVHSQELGYWYTMQAARAKRELGFKLVLTVWETLPLLDAYRNVRTRPYRALALAETDLFLAATERARDALLLEGAEESRIRVCPPGVDVGRFAAPRTPGEVPTILSPARLVWEKGHQDVLRALALLRTRGNAQARLVIVGSGPEEQRLRAYASELGLADAVEFRGFIPYEEMPAAYAQRVLRGARKPADDLLGGAVRHGARRGDGRRRADRGLRVGGDPRGRRRATRSCSRRATGWAWPTRSPRRSATGGRARRDERYSTPRAAEGIAAAYDDVLGRAPAS